MVRLVTGGAAEFNALVYQERHPGTLQYLSGQFQDLMARGGQLFTEAGQRFMQQAYDIHEKLVGENALERARALARAVTNVFDPDSIRAIWKLDELQAANPRTQRFIMADPVVRAKYHRQEIDGYSGTYTDINPSVIGDQHADYRRMENGILRQTQTTNKDGEVVHDWHIVHYYEGELEEGERDLDVSEVADVDTMRDAVKAYLAEGMRDPTNALGGNL